MSLSTRQRHIVDLLRDKEALSVAELAHYFQVTPQTIRRDLNRLYMANLLRRHHGGAQIVHSPVNSSFQSRRIRHLPAKARIGAAVAALIPQGSSLLFGFGTTPEQVALALAQHQHLTVVTNNLAVALALNHEQSNRIVLPGGCLRQPNPEILGAEAVALFQSYRADFGVYGAGGVDSDGVLLDFDRDEVACHTALRQSCRVRILVLDSSKFGRHAPMPSGHVQEADYIVTHTISVHFQLAQSYPRFIYEGPPLRLRD
ncbi:MAG: DeoR/GlpR transcriptional regulator [Alcaligenaceae bacterium]|nr:DeoR/GlpR transcriptional regulator [Alcaligenaceae bacterium]